MAPPELPRQIGAYRVLKRLAYGGMAEVLLAETSGADGFSRTVVIKRVLAQYSSSEEFVTMFRDEARVTAPLQHGNIVQVLEFGEQDGQFHLVLEYVNGPSLGVLLTRLKELGERLPPEVSIHVATEVARALDYAHRKKGPDGAPLQIVHRDVTPSNILLTQDGEVKLADFGIARARSRLTTSVQGSGVIKGKLPYLPPETLRTGAANARLDLYSLGVVLYEMLTGTRPFAADSEVEILTQVLDRQVPPVSALVPELPQALSAAVADFMARDPEQRPSRGQEIVQRLANVGLPPQAVTPAEALAGVIARVQRKPQASPPADEAPVQEERTPSVRPTTTRPPVLIIDESRAFRAMLRAALAGGYAVHEATTGEEAVTLTLAAPPRVVVLQRNLRGRSWPELVAALRDAAGDADPLFVLIAADADVELEADAHRAGIARVLPRAEVVRTLSATLKALLDASV